MKKIKLTIYLCLYAFCFFSQGLPTGTCNESGASINTIFYPNTSQYYNNNSIYEENLYLCGPNTIVYDTVSNFGNCRVAYLNAYTKYCTNNSGCATINAILAKNNSTVVIMPNGGDIRIWYEPNATIIDQTNGSGVQTFSCTAIVFPTVNCTSTGTKENNLNSAFEIYPNPANDVLNIKFNSEIKDFSKIEILNSLGQVVREEDISFKNKIAGLKTNELPSGVYLLNLKSNKSTTASKRFVVAH